MRVFTFDGSFAGLLSAVFDAYARKEFPDALLDAERGMPLLAASAHRVVTDREKAARVYRGLRARLHAGELENLQLAWLAEEPETPLALLRYMRLIFDRQRNPGGDLADPLVFSVAEMARRTRQETHKLEGFVRFQKCADGLYFACVAPRHNVLCLLLPHFAERFADQNWALYDCRRRQGAFHEKGRFSEMRLDKGLADALAASGGRLGAGLLAENEALFQELWKAFFTATAIRERANPRAQDRCLPRRFRPFMTETR